jgi:prepilin-type processing-associated H-X9-DG protein
VTVLPGFDQKRQNMGELLQGLDRTATWSVEKNQSAARTRLLALACPGTPPPVAPDQPAFTSYVGIGGLGNDAPALAWLMENKPSPRSGCYRFDAPTPFDSIADGLSQTLLIGEKSNEWGPWLAGGRSTVLGLDNSPDARALQGTGGQFGGCHPNGANWGFADGSVRIITDRADVKVLYGLSTIAGREADVLPGE